MEPEEVGVDALISERVGNGVGAADERSVVEVYSFYI